MLYENYITSDLFKDLHNIGMSGDRAMIRIFKSVFADGGYRNDPIEYSRIIFEELNSEKGKITEKMLVDLLIDGKYEVTSISNKARFRNNSDASKRRIEDKVKWTTAKTLTKGENDLSKFIDLLAEQFSVKTEIVLEIDGTILKSKENKVTQQA